MCKINLKDAYFSVILSKDFRKLIKFQCKKGFYECVCLCFGLGPAPKVSSKLLKVVSAKAFDGLGGNNNLGRSPKEIQTR